MDRYDDLGDDDRDALSDGAVRDTYIRLERWDEAAGLCRDMDAIRDGLLTDEGAAELKAALPAHLTLEHDGAGWWNVVDVELAAPDITQLIAAGSWRKVAQALTDGDTIAGDMLMGWQAAYVAAYLPDALRLDREGANALGKGGAWHVRREFFAKVGVA